MADKEIPDAPPVWFEQFRNEMGQAVAGLNSQQQAMGQQIAAQQAQGAQPAVAPPSAGQDEHLLNQLVASPTRFVNELENTIARKAAEQTQQAILDADANRRTEEAAQRFEDEYFSRNPELREYRALLVDKMMKQPAHLTPNDRAEAAGDEVRGMLKNAQAEAIENEKRQRAAALRAGGAQGLRPALEEGVADAATEAQRQQAAFEEDRDYRLSRL